MKRTRTSPLFALSFLLLLGGAAVARADGPSNSDLKMMADTLWVMVAAMLVFFMNAGFGCVESGFCRAKNCVNIMSKNFIVFATASIGFWLVGWGLMFGTGTPLVGTEGVFMMSGADNSPATAPLAKLIKADLEDDKGAYRLDLSDTKYEALLTAIEAESEKARTTITKADQEYAVRLEIPEGGTFTRTYPASDFYWGAYGSIGWAGVPLWAKFFFQLVFAGTAATIVSGVVAERIKYLAFILFSFVMAILIYPVVGHWIWGGGWLGSMGFVDFAGSTQVHSVGGWAGLVGALVLGPRLGKYNSDGKVHPIPGHNLTVATIGCFILWLGWFGFNPGSTMALDASAIAEIAVVTNTAAATGILSATTLAWLLLGKPDLGMTLNGCLAGLVAITAPCAFVTVGAAAIIGVIAGVLCVLAVLFFDRVRIDDPVGALSVHLVNGVFGTLCIGLFATPELVAARGPSGMTAGLLYGAGASQLIIQLIGAGAAAAYVLVVALAAWMVLKVAMGIRVSPEEEVEGLDLGEHGNEAYHGFMMAAMPREHVPSEAVSPRPAVAPPRLGRRFSVILRGMEPGQLSQTWSDLCQKTDDGPPSSKFLAVYPYLTTMEGNRFNFRGGEPEQVSRQLEQLFQERQPGAKITVSVE